MVKHTINVLLYFLGMKNLLRSAPQIIPTMIPRALLDTSYDTEWVTLDNYKMFSFNIN